VSRGPLKTALWPLQQAIYNRLANDPILTQMVTAVYDEVEEGAIMPYVQIGDDTTTPYDTKTDYGEQTTLTLHAWSAGPGKSEAKRIMGAILQAITAAPLTLEGFTIEEIKREFLETFNDGQAYHGVCRFRVYIKQL
jgi:hypothetical protein